MADVYMKSKFYFRRGKAASWAAQNFILGPGEPGFELDTGKLKVGNGVTPWNELPYVTDNIVLPAEVVKYLGSVNKLPEDAFDGEICEINDMFYIHSKGQWKQIGGTATKPGVVEVIKVRDDGSPNPTVEFNGIKYNSIEDALANVSDGDLIVIPANFNSVISIPANKNAGIELKNINIKNDEETPLAVGYQSTLTVSGAGTMECRKHAEPTMMNSGNMYINGGTYIRTLDSAENGYYTVVNHGNMTFNGGLVSCDKEYSSLIENGYWDYSDSNPAKGFVVGQNEAAPKLIINDGSFMGGLYIIKNDDNGYVEINGGNFYGTIYTCGFDYNNTDGKNTTFWFTSCMLIDLTESFGAGKEPSKEWMDKYVTAFADSQKVPYIENLSELFKSIADAIRAKSGQTGEIFACDFADRIRTLLVN